MRAVIEICVCIIHARAISICDQFYLLMQEQLTSPTSIFDYGEEVRRNTNRT